MNTKALSFGAVCAGAIAILLAAAALASYYSPAVVSADIDSPRCTTRLSGSATVGSQVSSVVAATTSLAQAGADRAFLRIQQALTTGSFATSTVYLSLDEGAPAVVGQGMMLATTTPYVDIGLNTNHPYTGTVTAITNSGSTTVLVEECVY